MFIIMGGPWWCDEIVAMVNFGNSFFKRRVDDGKKNLQILYYPTIASTEKKKKPVIL